MSAATHLPFDRLGPFRLERELGRGAMGQVFVARQDGLERAVALKVLPAALAGDETFVRRFLREARAAAAVKHPNVVGVIDAGEDRGVRYIAFELVEGPSLEALVRAQDPPGEARTRELLLGLARGLQAIHAAGLIHRDVKPENVLVRAADGVPRLADLGLAKRSEEDGAQETALTVAGAVLGTPLYMSPEQAVGDPVDGRSDLYSLGLTAHFLTYGKSPFGGAGDSVLKVLSRRLNADPPDLREVAPETSAGLARVVAGMCAREPAARYLRAEHVVAELGRLARGEQPLGPAAAAAAERARGPEAEAPTLLGGGALVLEAQTREAQHARTTNPAITQPPPRAPTQPGAHAPTQPGAHAPTQPGAHAPTQLGAHAPTQLGAHAPTQLGAHAPTQLGAHAPTQLGAHAPTQLGAHAPTVLGAHVPVQLGAHAPTQLDAHAPTALETPRTPTAIDGAHAPTAIESTRTPTAIEASPERGLRALGLTLAAGLLVGGAAAVWIATGGGSSSTRVAAGGPEVSASGSPAASTGPSAVLGRSPLARATSDATPSPAASSSPERDPTPAAPQTSPTQTSSAPAPSEGSPTSTSGGPLDPGSATSPGGEPGSEPAPRVSDATVSPAASPGPAASPSPAATRRPTATSSPGPEQPPTTPTPSPAALTLSEEVEAVRCIEATNRAFAADPAQGRERLAAVAAAPELDRWPALRRYVLAVEAAQRWLDPTAEEASRERAWKLLERLAAYRATDRLDRAAAEAIGEWSRALLVVAALREPEGAEVGAARLSRAGTPKERAAADALLRLARSFDEQPRWRGQEAARAAALAHVRAAAQALSGTLLGGAAREELRTLSDAVEALARDRDGSLCALVRVLGRERLGGHFLAPRLTRPAARHDLLGQVVWVALGRAPRGREQVALRCFSFSVQLTAKGVSFRKDHAVLWPRSPRVGFELQADDLLVHLPGARPSLVRLGAATPSAAQLVLPELDLDLPAGLPLEELWVLRLPGTKALERPRQGPSGRRFPPLPFGR
ncbi:MAG: protein kinase [Planctomycetota bacterium]